MHIHQSSVENDCVSMVSKAVSSRIQNIDIHVDCREDCDTTHLMMLLSGTSEQLACLMGTPFLKSYTPHQAQEILDKKLAVVVLLRQVKNYLSSADDSVNLLNSIRSSLKLFVPEREITRILDDLRVFKFYQVIPIISSTEYHQAD